MFNGGTLPCLSLYSFSKLYSNTFVNDLDKVLSVTKDQIMLALSEEPTKIEEFTEALPKFSKSFHTINFDDP